ncbi:MAG: hydrogenase maturation protease [Actinomycetota bacterium]
MSAVVIIGLGNEAAHDDAIGIEVVRSLARPVPPAGLRLVEADGDPARLLAAWEAAEVAVVVDAARVGSVAPVTVIDGEEAALRGDDRRSSHGLGLAEAVELGRALGRLPGRLVVVAVAGERFEPGFGLSETGRRNLGEAVAVVRRLTSALGLDRRDGNVDEAPQAAGQIETQPS